MDAKQDIKDLPVDKAGAAKVHGGGVILEQRSIIDPNVRLSVPDAPERLAQ